MIAIFKSRKGQSLIELLVAIGVASLLLPALFTSFMASKEGRPQQDQRTRATLLVKEAQEAVRIVRDKDWNNFAVNGTFHAEALGTTWFLSAGSETIDNFTRQIVISDAYRDLSGVIVLTGGIIDPSTKKVQVNVSWNTPLATTVSSVVYITRHTNITYTETTEDDFNSGIKDGVTIANMWGGEVILGTGGSGNWCSPNLSINPLDLPGQGITTAISAVQGHAYTTTGGNASGNSMDSMAISNSSPPVAVNDASYNNYKTYGIYTDSSYAYLTSDHPKLTVDIIEISSKPYAQVGTFASSGGGSGVSVFVAYNSILGKDIGFVTVGNRLYTFDLSERTGSRNELGHIDLAGTGKRVIVIGNYAYVVIASTTEQLAIYDISDPLNILKVSSAHVNDRQATDLFVNPTGTRVYLVTKQASTPENDFFILDTSSKITTLPVPLGVYNTGTMNPKGVVAVSGNMVIIVGSGGEQYQVLNLSKVPDFPPFRCGGLTNPNGATSINAIASVLEDDGDAYSYILTDNASKEFQIIAGGPGGGLSPLGTFESKIFDATYSIAFNNFSVNFLKPSQTNIKFQVAVADAVGGSCSGATFNFIGPDATSTTFFTTSSAIPVIENGNYKNPGRCFKYKAYLSTQDSTQTPVLEDITINYSP
ncbi:MAG: hypothetical protein ABH816_00355 [Candidatus Levyibacteriota bacterium]